MGVGSRGVNAIGFGCANPEETKFKALYNEECRVARNKSSRRVADVVGEPDLIRRLTQDIFKLESVNLGEPREIIGESSAIPTKTVVWTPTATGGPVKFG
uniref:Uncharacterized protein n=1 Tax=Solanum tuberosum TaxID=4113 RepID=M1DVK9_SOLTU